MHIPDLDLKLQLRRFWTRGCSTRNNRIPFLDSAVVYPLVVDGTRRNYRHQQFLDRPDVIGQFRRHRRRLPLPALLADLHREGEGIHRARQVVDPILPRTRRLQCGQLLGV